jgi:hypothetical protein
MSASTFSKGWFGPGAGCSRPRRSIRKVARDVAIEVGDFPTDREKPVAHRNLFNKSPVPIDDLVRQPKHYELLMLPVSV